MSANVERVREVMALADAMRVDELVDAFRRRRGDGAALRTPGEMPRRYEGKAAIADFQPSPATRSPASP